MDGEGLRFCPHDGSRLSDSPEFGLQVRTAEARPYGWALSGLVVLADKLCPVCGQAFEYVAREVPIHCAEFPCPDCGAVLGLEYKVSRIARAEDDFEFTAEITCGRCRRRRRLSALLTKLLDLLSIEIGPTGISVKKK